jgi:hypothetical protein
LRTIAGWLTRGEQFHGTPLRLSWPTLFPFLQLLWPLRL